MPVSDGIWSAIEEQIPTKKDRPKLWLIYLLFAFAIPLAILQMKHNTGDSLKLNNLQSNNQEATVVEYFENERNRANLPLQQEQRTQNTVSNTSTIKNQPSFLNTQNLNNQQKLTLASLDNFKQNDRGNTSTKVKSKNAIITQQDFKKIDSKSQENKLKFLLDPFKVEKKKLKKVNSNSFKLIEKFRIFQGVNVVNYVDQVKTLESEGIEYRNRLLDKNLSKSIGKRLAVGCPKFEKISSGLYLFGEFRPGLSKQTLSPNSLEQHDVANQRRSIESGHTSFYFSAGLGREWKSGFLVETGISYDQINTMFEYAYKWAQLDEFGQPIESTSIIVEDRSTNKFTQINVPVLIGQNIPLYKNLSLVARAGVLINVSSTNSGKIYSDEMLTPLEYSSSSDTPSLFKTNLGLAYIGGLDLQKDLSPILSAYAGLNLGYYPSSFSLSTNPIDQTYLKYGLTTGIKYRL